jgi:alpha-beta hydrolase superfamily lysophospholipase
VFSFKRSGAVGENDGWTEHHHAASDGYQLCARHYAAVGVSRARIVCVHGIQSHAGWYSHSCRRLAEAGYDVSFLDRRGSGRNTVGRGDAPSFRRLLDDVGEFLPRLPRPLFLVAISWGGKLAAGLMRRQPGLIDGLILVAPGFCPRVAPTPRERLAILWSRLVNPRRPFPVPLNEPELFTATPHRQEFLRTDPLALRQATARFFVESVRLDWYLRFAAKHVTMPVLTLLAEKDRIIDNSRTRAFVERFPSRDKQIIEYAGAHHTLEFEPNPDLFIADVTAWLDRHCPT